MPSSEHDKRSMHSEDAEVQQAEKEKREAEREEKKQRGFIGAAIAIGCAILETMIFVLCVVGTPIDVFRSKLDTSPRYCYSMWGYKRCGAYRANPNGLPYKGFPSSGIHDTMNAAAAFSIISIFMTLVATISTILLVFKCISKMIPGVLSIVAFLTTLIVWACQAGVYHRNYDVVTAGGVRLQADIRSGFNYAGSFGLFVTAWCLQTIVMVLVFFA